MATISTKFAGLNLTSPIIVGSNSLTASVNNIIEYASAGAGAVVLKSLFEESITRELAVMGGGEDHPESYDYLSAYVSAQIVSDYIELIKEAKSKCSIPVIASIACNTDGKWEDFAKNIEQAGADALELNIMSISTTKDYNFGDFEKMHISIVKNVSSIVNIPVIVKLGANISNPVALISALYSAGAKGVVLFNRFFPTDIDIEKMAFTMSNPFTVPADLSQSIRWAGIVNASLPKIPIAVSGGVHCWKGVVKSVLAGADAVEVASAIIQKGPKWIEETNAELAKWQDANGYQNIESYKGKMNAEDPDHADKLMRTQFVKHFSSVH